MIAVFYENQDAKLRFGLNKAYTAKFLYRYKPIKYSINIVWTDFTYCSSVFIVDFELVNAGWVVDLSTCFCKKNLVLMCVTVLWRYFEIILHIVLVLLLLTLIKWLSAGC